MTRDPFPVLAFLMEMMSLRETYPLHLNLRRNIDFVLDIVCIEAEITAGDSLFRQDHCRSSLPFHIIHRVRIHPATLLHSTVIMAIPLMLSTEFWTARRLHVYHQRPTRNNSAQAIQPQLQGSWTHVYLSRPKMALSDKTI